MTAFVVPPIGLARESIYPAATSTDIKGLNQRKKVPQRVARCLFGPPDHKEIQKLCDDMNEEQKKNFSNKYTIISGNKETTTEIINQNEMCNNNLNSKNKNQKVIVAVGIEKSKTTTTIQTTQRIQRKQKPHDATPYTRQQIIKECFSICKNNSRIQKEPSDNASDSNKNCNNIQQSNSNKKQQKEITKDTYIE